MKIKDYIQGNKHGKEANRLEREAMIDPFLQEALDGFDKIAGDHAKIVQKLEKKYTHRNHISRPRRLTPLPYKRLFIIWTAAASILLFIIGFSAYLLLERNENRNFTYAEILPDAKENAIPFDPPTPQQLQIDETQREILNATKESKENNSSPKYSSPIIVKDENIDSMSDIILSDAEAISSSDMSETSIDEESITYLVEKKQDNPNQSEAVTVEYDSQKKLYVKDVISRSSKNDSVPIPFGEKEFQAYCQQKVDKKVCNSKSVSVKVSFLIDETGKPANIEYKKYSCKDAKKEIENLLATSPVWTKTNRRVTITIKW